MFFKKVTSMLLCCVCFVGMSVFGAEHTVNQKGKAFSMKTLTVKVGDTVNFLNKDDFFHNVFSLSDAKFFDLGSYPQGESKSVVFDQVGTVEVECAIHPEMRMIVEVSK